MEARDIIIRPVVTEKTNDLMSDNQYTFEVAMRANKTQIRQAVEHIFDVDVVRVNTLKVRGKMRRMGRHQGRQSDWKKAIVTVVKGQSIEIFEGL